MFYLRCIQKKLLVKGTLPCWVCCCSKLMCVASQHHDSWLAGGWRHCMLARYTKGKFKKKSKYMYIYIKSQTTGIQWWQDLTEWDKTLDCNFLCSREFFSPPCNHFPEVTGSVGWLQSHSPWFFCDPWLWDWKHRMQLSSGILNLHLSNCSPSWESISASGKDLFTRSGVSCCRSFAEGWCFCGWVDRKGLNTDIFREGPRSWLKLRWQGWIC